MAIPASAIPCSMRAIDLFRCVSVESTEQSSSKQTCRSWIPINTLFAVANTL